jgi:DNA repair photolyase
MTTAEPRRCSARARPQRRRSAPTVIDRLRWDGGRRVLTTTAGLSAADIAELADAARFGPVEVRFRIPTMDRRLAAVLDPHAPAPPLRLVSLRAARRAGLLAGVVAAPLIPGVTAAEAGLTELFARAKAAGALFVDDEIVIPGRPRRDELARLLRRRYPRVAARFEVWLRTSDRTPAEERIRIESALEALRARFRLPRRVSLGTAPQGDGRQIQFGFAV